MNDPYPWLPHRALAALNHLCEHCARLHGDTPEDPAWKKLKPGELLDKASRHMARYLVGLDGEPHDLCAALRLLQYIEATEDCTCEQPEER